MTKLVELIQKEAMALKKSLINLQELANKLQEQPTSEYSEMIRESVVDILESTPPPMVQVLVTSDMTAIAPEQFGMEVELLQLRVSRLLSDFKCFEARQTIRIADLLRIKHVNCVSGRIEGYVDDDKLILHCLKCDAKWKLATLKQ
ncbi:MAG: hypothetical protein ACFFDP_06645 [Promethearchaeota archaeon]